MNFRFLQPNKTATEVELSDNLDINSACYNSQTGDVMIGLTNEQGESEIHFYKSNGQLKSKIDSFKVYDCVWDNRSNRLYLSNGNTFFKLEEGQNKPEKIVKFNHVKYAPNKCSLSPSAKHIGLLKWKADNDRFHLINIETRELVDVKLICCSYSWIDDNTIIFSTLGGKIGYFDLNKRKKTSSPFNVKSILKSNHPSMIRLQESINELDKERQAWIHFDDPISIGDSVYFVINSGTLFGSALIKYQNSEFDLLFSSEDKIQTYELDDFENARMNMARAINFKWSYYSLVEENCDFKEPEHHFYLNKSSRMNQVIILKEANNA
ncbi:MAG TPA: hypothetical protein VMV56_01070 [Williamwhitmania sp.]|nr:hypothetical protein [Williamwhitmania sp.]